jgi:amino acid adenylation domain-containing protein
MGDEATPRIVLEHPASGAQQRLWFVEQLSPGQPVHNLSAEVELDAAPEAGPLAAALADVVARHEALRTTFRMDGGRLHQVVWSALPAVPVEPVTVDGPDPDGEWLRRRQELAGRVFDPGAGPLLRLYPARVGTGRHALVVVAHHLVVDGISFEILLRDLSTAYRARQAGNEPDFAPLPVQFADFTAWQDGRTASPEAVADLAFWRDRLQDLPTIDLTRGRPRPIDPGHHGGEIVVPVDTAAVEALRHRASARGATLFMALTALWAEAVGRWFGATDVPIGTSVAGRPLDEVADVIGMFVDRVVLRMDTAGRPSFDELLDRAREVVLAANDHTAVTFEQVVDAVRPPRTLGVTPLYQVGVNLVPLSAITDGQYGNGTVRHDLNLDVLPSASGLKARLEYRHGVVAEPDAAGLAGLFGRLVEAAVRAPQRPLRDVPAVPDPAAAIQAGPVPDGPDANLADLFFAQAARTPHATALVTPQVTHTYRELAGRAAAVAERLRGKGLGPEDPVLLAMPRRAELIVGMLGVLAAGGAYVPVDPAAPRRHVASVAAATGARFALVPDGAITELPAGVEPLAVGEPGEGAVPPAGTLPRIDPRQAAYILFTSGTTGTPKGVVVEHRQVVAYARAMAALLDPPEDASYLMVQPPTFDSCVTQIYGALLRGGVLHLVDEDLARDPGGLADYCTAHPIDYLKIVPSHLSALLAGDRGAALRPRRAAIIGGEGCPSDVIAGLRRDGWPVVGHYGPTETTVGVLAHRFDDRVLASVATTPLGPPLPGVRGYVLDAAGDPVVPGTVGELYLGGALVARGYAGRGGRTAEVFLPDPHGAPGQRRYRTGDLVRQLPGGWYEFVGRCDRQVKVGGHRVEPGAVEAVLHRHPDVRQAVVVVRDQRLVGYVVAAAGRRADEAALRAHVAGELPAGSVPSAIVVLAALPQKTNGKLDQAALPDPVTVLERGHTAPATATETALAAVVAAVLGRPDVSVTDSFFDLGGDSIRAIYLVAQAATAGLAVTVRDVFAQQTVRAIAAAIDAGALAARATARDFYARLLNPGAAGPPAGDPYSGAAACTSAVLPQDVSLALSGAAHVAYGTDTAQLLLAAVAGELLDRTGGGAVPVLVRLGDAIGPVAVVAADRDPGTVVRAAKAAHDTGHGYAGQWHLVRTEPDVAPWAPRLLVSVGPVPDGEAPYRIVLDGDRIVADAPVDAAAVADRLTAIVRHCCGTGASYTVADFPDAGLDDAALQRLLHDLGVDRAG